MARITFEAKWELLTTAYQTSESPTETEWNLWNKFDGNRKTYIPIKLIFTSGATLTNEIVSNKWLFGEGFGMAIVPRITKRINIKLQQFVSWHVLH